MAGNATPKVYTPDGLAFGRSPLVGDAVFIIDAGRGCITAGPALGGVPHDLAILRAGRHMDVDGHGGAARRKRRIEVIGLELHRGVILAVFARMFYRKRRSHCQYTYKRRRSRRPGSALLPKPRAMPSTYGDF